MFILDRFKLSLNSWFSKPKILLCRDISINFLYISFSKKRLLSYLSFTYKDLKFDYGFR